MGFRPYLFGLAALLGVAISSPVEAQETVENCAHNIVCIPENPFEDIPPNPYCNEYPSGDEEPIIEDFFWEQDQGAGSIDLRLEIPDYIRFDLSTGRIHGGPFTWINGNEREGERDHYLYEDLELEEVFRPLRSLPDNLYIADTSFDEALTSIEEIPRLYSDLEGSLTTLWNEFRGVLGSRRTELGLIFSFFFRQALPQYTEDDVVTPEELIEIIDQTQTRIEDVYDRTLTESEREEIDQILTQFTNEVNRMLEYYTIDDRIQGIINSDDPLSDIRVGPMPLRMYWDILSGLEPLLRIVQENNNLTIDGQAYVRISGYSDRFTRYVQQSSYGNFEFYHGNYSGASVLAEAHLHFEAELHAGRPLREFESLDLGDDTDAIIDSLEGILGYQPRSIDTTASGSIRLAVEAENSWLDGYQLIRRERNRYSGLGITHGFVHRASLDLNADVAGFIDSYAYQMGLDITEEMHIVEEQGPIILPYFVVGERSSQAWYDVFIGGEFEHLRIREEIQRLRLHFESDFDGNNTTEFTNTTETHSSQETRVRPFISFVGGLEFDHVSPFLYVDSLHDEYGAGMHLTAPQWIATIRVGYPGEVTVDTIVGLTDRIRGAREWQRENIRNRHSAFPARHAQEWHANQQFYGGLDGLFLEGGFRAVHEENNPHDVPVIARVGLMAAERNVLYLRMGVEGYPSLRALGSYVELGNEFFGINAAMMYEDIPVRESSATNVRLRSRISIDEFDIFMSLSGLLLSPATSHHLGISNGFNYSGTLHIEGSF